MTNEQIIRRFRKDYGLSGKRWQRFCQRYVNRDLTTIVRFIRGQYKDVPTEFRDFFKAEMERVCSQK